MGRQLGSFGLRGFCIWLGSSVNRVREPNETTISVTEMGTEQRTKILSSGSRLVRFGARFSVKFVQPEREVQDLKKLYEKFTIYLSF